MVSFPRFTFWLGIRCEQGGAVSVQFGRKRSREVPERPVITSLHLLAVLIVLSEYASLIEWGASSGARFLLTRLSRTSPRHAVRKAD